MNISSALLTPWKVHNWWGKNLYTKTNEKVNAIIYPPKLKLGDHIRVIAPARSLSLLSQDTIDQAKRKLEEYWFIVSFWKHVSEMDEFLTSFVESRIADLHDAFRDPNVHGILSVVWWYSANQMLDYIDYDLIKNNPKILCGFSDITALSNAIFAKTWVVGYSWPHFSSWAIQYWFEYSIEFFEKCCIQSDPYALYPSSQWSDDEWYLDQEKRNFIENEWYWVLNEGKGDWLILGGHIPCVWAVQWTQYFPIFDKNFILFIEIDEEFSPVIFDRLVQSLIQQSGFPNIQWMIIGRFQHKTKMTRALLEKIIRSKWELAWIPIIANVDFWHTMPFLTFPIWGSATIDTSNKDYIMIKNH